MTIYTATQSCQFSVYIDSSMRACHQNLLFTTRLMEWAYRNGWKTVQSSDLADALFISTCVVNGERIKDSIAYVRELASVRKKGAPIYILGCARGLEDELQEIPDLFVYSYLDLNRMDSIFGEKVLFSNIIVNVIDPTLYLHYQQEYESPNWGIQIGIGCAYACSYCLIKRNKGIPKSRPISEIIREAEAGLSSGHRQMALLCDDLGSWGLDLGLSMEDLLESLSEKVPKAQFVVNYLHPSKFLEHFDCICRYAAAGTLRYLCVPIQHVVPFILKSMNRDYDPHTVIEHVGMLKVIAPKLRITNHVIFGYPGESENDFETLLMESAANYDAVVCFLFNPSKSTTAWKKMQEHEIDEHAILRRVATIECLSKIMPKFSFGHVSLSNHAAQPVATELADLTLIEKIKKTYVSSTNLTSNLANGKSGTTPLKVMLIRLARETASDIAPYGLSVLERYISDHTDCEVVTLDMVKYALSPYLAIRFVNPDIVGISVTNANFELLRDLYPQILDGHTQIVVGGPYPTSSPHDVALFPNAIFVLGEGERSIVEIIEAVKGGRPLKSIKGIAYFENGKVVINDPQPFLGAGEIPSPVFHYPGSFRYSLHPLFWHATRTKEVRIAPIMTSRGCSFHCAFCHKVFGDHVRHRPVENVIKDFEFLRDNGVEEVYFLDDLLIPPRERYQELFGAIRALHHNMRLALWNGLRADILEPQDLELAWEAGVRHLLLPYESASPRIQKLMNKNLNLRRLKEACALACQMGFLVHTNVLVGWPTQTEDELKYELDFIQDLTVHDVYPLYPSIQQDNLLFDQAVAVAPGVRDQWRSTTTQFNTPSILAACSPETVQEYYHQIAVLGVAKISTSESCTRLKMFHLEPSDSYLDQVTRNAPVRSAWERNNTQNHFTNSPEIRRIREQVASSYSGPVLQAPFGRRDSKPMSEIWPSRKEILDLLNGLKKCGKPLGQWHLVELHESTSSNEISCTFCDETTKTVGIKLLPPSSDEDEFSIVFSEVSEKGGSYSQAIAQARHLLKTFIHRYLARRQSCPKTI